MNDLAFAWKVANYVKSNAIVFVGGGMIAGRGRRPDDTHRLGPHRLDQRPRTRA